MLAITMTTDIYEEKYYHEDEVGHLIDAKADLKRLIEAVYITGNIYDIDSAIEDLAFAFDVEIPEKEPQVRKA